ncbi:hypothetical protein ACPCAG_03025 [Streptomyces pseudogriseolus]|uniref:hypothetical protein n=1 Tax=Streptomyces pseudogriseolus TaxID=36817 RepID=UPI003FA265B8
MKRTPTNDRFARTRNGGAGFGRGGGRSDSSAPSRSGRYGRRPAAVQGGFALPETLTPALPAVEGFADLDMPRELPALHRITGAQAPSGIPVVITAPAA